MISIRGAREHNLQDVDVEIGGGLTVVTGISGSGKTSLVFDTLYHEARRRFMDVFALGSPEGRLAPALVREIEGLGPAVAVGQNLLNRNPSSTVASASGLHPLLRLLYARFGRRHCALCGAPHMLFSEDELVERLIELSTQATDCLVVVPLVRAARGSHRTLLAWLTDEFGPAGLRVDGGPAHAAHLDPARPHSIELTIAHLTAPLPAGEARRIVGTAAGLGVPALVIRRAGLDDEVLSRVPACFTCGAWYGDLDPFHFHAPCPRCSGAGCERCGGSGLHPEAAAVRWQGLRLPDLLAQSVAQVRALFDPAAPSSLPSGAHTAALPPSAERLRAEIARRLESLEAVGLGYVSLDRSAPTLSRGEAQRVRLAVILTSRLEDMLHVLDEPTVGLHPADVARLLPVLRRLGGPVVYVEHDRLAVVAADQAIDLGPGAGAAGGRVLFSGPPAELWRTNSASGRFFSLRERVALPGGSAAAMRSPPDADAFLWLRGAHAHNLRHVDVPLPLARMSVITGVSGSGKSSLVEDVLMASLLGGEPAGCRALEVAGKPARLRAVMVDQSPIGVNPRSNPATYTGLADVIREVFAAGSGLSASHFSFNRPEGACATCGGMGALEVQMRYLPSSWVPCPACEGRRFSDEVLAAQVTLGGRRLSIADLFALSIAEVTPLLLESATLPRAKRAAARAILEALRDVGLGYLALGQPSPTLSGGEAERVKLAKYLGKPSLAGELFVLDEPSTGLHPQDVAGLLVVLARLVRSGATVVVVEHCTDIIRAADWVVDLGPGAGPAGGQVLYAGPPAGLLTTEGSLTGEALREEEKLRPSTNSATNSVERINESRPRGQDRSADKRMEAADDSTPAAGAFNPAAVIAIRGAWAHNLQNVSLDIPKGALTVVSGVSGSGKSSLVDDVLEAEARRRYLESLSMYERQATHEGPEAEVESVTGLGVAIAVTPERRLYERRATVGSATELAHQLAALLACAGERACLICGAAMQRVTRAGDDSAEHGGAQTAAVTAGASAAEDHPTENYQSAALRTGARQAGMWQREQWSCPRCGATAPLAEPRHFDPATYAAACLTCHGLGTLQTPAPEKLIIHPDKPLCSGAMYSPGFFPKGYLCKPGNGGYEEVQALAERYGFDPCATPWNAMRPEARQAFLFGDPEPLAVTHYGRNGRTQTTLRPFRGYYGWVRDWDVGSTYTTTTVCPTCGGARLRPEYRAVTLGGYNMPELSEMPLARLSQVLETVEADWPRGTGYRGLWHGIVHTGGRNRNSPQRTRRAQRIQRGADAIRGFSLRSSTSW